MKRLHFILIISLVFFIQCGHSFGQDYIVRLEHSTRIVQCENIYLSNNTLRFTDSEKGGMFELSEDDIYAINFRESGQHELIIQSLLFDTIECKIDTISSQSIYYRQEDHLLKSLDKNEVFGIFFNKNQSIYEIEKFKETFFAIQKSLNRKEIQITRKSGEVVKISKLISIDEEKVSIAMTVDEVEMKTFLKLNDVDGIVFMEPLKKAVLRSNQTFLLTTNDNWHLVQDIHDMNKDFFYVTLFNVSKEIPKVYQPKERIKGIFFYDYKSTENISQAIQELNLQSSNTAHKAVKIDVNFGGGYLIAATPEGIDSQTEKYIDEMRAGLVLDVNFNIFPKGSFGFGFKYNQYKTSNSILNVLEDNIKVRFIGLSLISNPKFKNNRGYGFFAFSIGSISEINNLKVQNESFVVKGSTLGMCFSTGIDFLLSENFSIGFQCGIVTGLIKEYDVDGQKVELEEPESLLRIDGSVGLKIYL